MNLAGQITSRAQDLGFDLVGIAPAGEARHAEAYRRWLDAGYAGGMAWMAKDAGRRIQPAAKTVVVCGLSYFVQDPPPELWNDPARGRIARYAWGRDYHNVMLPMLNELAEFISSEAGRPLHLRTYVDTGPVLERDVAEQAGVGIVGKNTNLINPQFGSYIFIGEILIDLEGANPLAPNTGRKGLRPSMRLSCGRCVRCLAACPTGALVEPYVLDARRCISYLTIENKGAIPEDLRPKMKNWIFGCDECQQVCPWNASSAPHRGALQTAEAVAPHGVRRVRFLRFDPDTCAPKLAEVMALDEKAFRDRFDGTPVMRAKRRGLLRNAAVALGNSGDRSALPALEKAMRDKDPLIREHAMWAIGQVRGL